MRVRAQQVCITDAAGVAHTVEKFQHLDGPLALGVDPGDLLRLRPEPEPAHRQERDALPVPLDRDAPAGPVLDCGAGEGEYLARACAARDANGTSWYDLTAQAFAVFLPIRSVGVMGDGRTYEHAVALRAVQTTDFMTAHWAHLPHELLGRVSNRIINEVRGINRVVYDISGKPPATIEWE